MAASPEYKVYNTAGEYIAACKYGEDAAALVALQGDGAKIKWDHSVVLWTEGAEDQPAGESYDHVRETMHERQRRHNVLVYERNRGAGSAAKVRA